MQLIPDEQEVLQLFRSTGALRHGHFEYPNGLHTNQHLEIAFAVRSYQNAKIIGVALSRLLRLNAELRVLLPELSIVAASTVALPIAYAFAEALHLRRVYWVKKPDEHQPVQLAMTVAPGELAVLLDGVLRSGAHLAETRRLLERQGAAVLAIAVAIREPARDAVDFGKLPIYSLACLERATLQSPMFCDLCKSGVPIERMGTFDESEDLIEAAAMAVY